MVKSVDWYMFKCGVRAYYYRVAVCGSFCLSLVVHRVRNAIFCFSVSLFVFAMRRAVDVRGRLSVLVRHRGATRKTNNKIVVRRANGILHISIALPVNPGIRFSAHFCVSRVVQIVRPEPRHEVNRSDPRPRGSVAALFIYNNGQ